MAPAPGTGNTVRACVKARGKKDTRSSSTKQRLNYDLDPKNKDGLDSKW
jgi:hypothetical protein